jgi:hypothetical protein
MLLAVSLLCQAAGYIYVPYCDSLTQLMLLFGTVSSTWNLVNTAGNTLVLWLHRDQVSGRRAAKPSVPGPPVVHGCS